MKTEITKIDWFLDKEHFEGTVTFVGKNGGTVQAFSYGTEFKIGDEIKLDLDSINYELKWETVFSENRNKEIKLVQKGKWEYEAYGRILNINPVIVDFGEFELNTGSWTNDKKAIGEYIYWKIERLDI